MQASLGRGRESHTVLSQREVALGRAGMNPASSLPWICSKTQRVGPGGQPLPRPRTLSPSGLPLAPWLILLGSRDQVGTKMDLQAALRRGGGE